MISGKHLTMEYPSPRILSFKLKKKNLSNNCLPKPQIKTKNIKDFEVVSLIPKPR